MKLQDISLNELKNILQTEKDFKDLSQWKFKHIPLGEMYHTYKITNGKKSLFVKELKPHEAQMEYFLTKLKLNHFPCSKYPNLLKEKILVREFIPGRMLRSKNIDVGLIKDFAIMRKKLRNKKFFAKHNIFKLNNYQLKDDGFYKKSFESGFTDSAKCLKRLDKYKLKEVDQFWNILEHLKKDKKILVKEYGKMPLDKQHQDFREDNIIIGKDGKQRLIDWGSSYGYNPFMFDVAPFIINNPQALDIYLKNSKTKGSKKQIQKLLYLGLIARFFDVVKYRLHPDEKRANTKKGCKKYMAYEYKTYKRLL